MLFRVVPIQLPLSLTILGWPFVPGGLPLTYCLTLPVLPDAGRGGGMATLLPPAMPGLLQLMLQPQQRGRLHCSSRAGLFGLATHCRAVSFFQAVSCLSSSLPGPSI